MQARRLRVPTVRNAGRRIGSVLSCSRPCTFLGGSIGVAGGAIAFALVRIRRCFGDARGGGHPRRDTQPLDSGDSLSTAHDALGIVATQSNHNSPYVTSHFAPSATSAIGLPRTSPFGQEIIGPWKTPAIHLIAPYHRHNKFRYLLLRATHLALAVYTLYGKSHMRPTGECNRITSPASVRPPTRPRPDSLH